MVRKQYRANRNIYLPPRLQKEPLIRDKLQATCREKLARLGGCLGDYHERHAEGKTHSEMFQQEWYAQKYVRRVEIAKCKLGVVRAI